MTRPITALLATLMFPATLFAQGAPVAEEPLLLKGDNTVLLDRSTYAGTWLQYYLIRCVAKAPDAMAYAPQAKPNRAAAPAFPIVKDPKAAADKTILAVGPASAFPEYLSMEEIARVNERPGTVLIRRQDNVILITGTMAPWDFAPISIFLDKVCGVRLYAPTEGETTEGELWLSMPKENEATVTKLDVFQRPYFAKTAFSTGSFKRNAEWNRMNSMLSEGSQMRASHTLINYMPPEKYYDKHPALYPMAANGTRPKPSGNAWNPCLADSDLAASVVLDEIRGRMQSKTPPDYVSLGVMDCAFDCKCPPCQESMKQNNGSYSNVYYTFLNKVARACKEQFPKLWLTAYVYSNVRTPPTGMRIEPNIVVDVVTKSYQWVDPARLQAEKDRIRSFSDLGASWITHDWDFSGVTPRIYNRQWAPFLQWAAQNGMKGIYTEWTADESWYIDGARYWVLRRQYSDPYADVDALWRQYCLDMYGPAAEEMYRFYDTFAEKHVFSSLYCERADLPRQEMACFTPDDLALQRKLLETAVAKTAADPLIQRRLAAVMRYFLAHELFCKAVGEPARLHYRYTVLDKKTGINKDALAFYANDNGQTLLQAVEYYDTKRTVAPDTNGTETALGGPLSYRTNYSRALGTILQAVRAEAMAGVDPAALTADGLRKLQADCARVLRANLPAKRDAARAAQLESMAAKILWVPRGKAMPKIDGDLADPAWKDAAELKDWTLADLLISSAQGNDTSGRIMRIGDHLVIGLDCKQPKGVWAQTAAEIETGTMIWRETCCEVLFGPPVREGEKPVYFQYIVNSLGAFRGMRAALDVRKDVLCAARMNADKTAYTLELALPLKTDRYDFTKDRVFTFNIMRQVYNSNSFSPPERLGWHPIFFTAHETSSRALTFVE
jgi:hypothetical protein